MKRERSKVAAALLFDPAAAFQAELNQLPQGEDKAPKDADPTDGTLPSDKEEEEEMARDRETAEKLAGMTYLEHRLAYQALLKQKWGDRGGPSDDELYNEFLAVSVHFIPSSSNLDTFCHCRGSIT